MGAERVEVFLLSSLRQAFRVNFSLETAACEPPAVASSRPFRSLLTSQSERAKRVLSAASAKWSREGPNWGEERAQRGIGRRVREREPLASARRVSL